NEEVALSQLLPRISQVFQSANRSFEIVVVNDGSRDRTSQILTELTSALNIRELCHKSNLGYGASLQTAFLWIAKEAGPDDALVTLDADNTQDPTYIPIMLRKLEEGYDAVTASYTMPGGRSTGIPFARRCMSAWVNQLLHWMIPLQGLTTYTNGF